MDVDPPRGERHRARRVPHSGRGGPRHSPYAIQRDPPSHERHEGFDPDRRLPERPKDVPKYAMGPSGVGNRECPDGHFSTAELTLITAAIACAHRFERAPGSGPRPRIGITLRPRRLLVRALPR